MSSDEQSDKECPLCMEALEIDDINFYPCKCEYQVEIKFCWHRLRTDENGLCPACRQPYPEDPVNFKPLTASDVQKMKTEKRQKQQLQKIKICESRKHLSSYRVLQKNLVYVVGLSARVADPETLKKTEYFGKYGRILKVAVGSSPSLSGPQSASFTAYVTYARYEDALRAIQAVNNAQLDGRIVKASLGTTKYCTNFLRSQPCYKPECMYLHDVADTEVSFTKDDMHLGRHAEYEKRLIESTLRERSQRGRTSFVINTSGKTSKSESAERRPEFRSAPIQNYEDKEKIFQSRSPSADKNVKIPVNQINGGLLENQPCSVTNNKMISNNKGVDKENEVRSHLEKTLGRTNDSSTVIEEQAVIPTTKVNEGIGSRSRLSEWISSSQSAIPRIATTCASIEKMFSNDKVDVSNEKTLQNSSSSQSGNGAEPCDWQRALGICGKIDSLTEESAIADFPAAYSSSQARVLPKSTRLSTHSDDDLGFDPISESAKGLADLLEEEKMILPQCSTQNVSGMTSVSSSLMSLGLQCGWPSLGISNGASSMSMRNALETDVDLTATATNNFANVGCYSHSNTQYHSNVSLAAANQVDGTKLQEWQEGFRALLPNVNVRFVSDLSATGYPSSRTSPMEMQRATNQFSSAINYDQTMPMSTQLLNPIASPVPPPLPSINSYSHPSQQWMMPPPGFSYVSKR
ncbi:unnamed protein product [Litomosoides sigmodontis]|uniref:CCR4-NOT transcription complex subunit 4 n=1 Tax=Litomosoides sigmodontis TaxID=42156 RepID=A0A3P6URG4_LITSI|nr:unnamed protein product [Litomosoides sigmodontis]